MAAPHTGTPFDLVGTTGSALAVLGLCLLALRVRTLRLLTRPVAAAGAMTLTLYTLHAVSLSADLEPWDDTGYYLLQAAVALGFATLWLAALPRGPLETLVHQLSTSAATLAVPPPDPRPPADEQPP